MRRFLKGAIYSMVPTALAALVLGVPTAAPDVIGAQNVNLACNDGTNLALALDVAGVTQLSNAVSAIGLYPAGDPALACSLNQPTAANSPTSSNGNGPQDFAVGGGQITVPFGTGCTQNFAISAHVPADAALTPGSEQPGAGGTANLSTPGKPSGCAFTGDLVSKVDCVQVSGDTANFTAEITKSTGDFITFGYHVGGEIAFQVRDLNKAIVPVPDEIAGGPPGTHPASACNFNAATTPGHFDVERGNISVHDN
jgi:hypothetical protein